MNLFNRKPKKPALPLPAFNIDVERSAPLSRPKSSAPEISPEMLEGPARLAIERVISSMGGANGMLATAFDTKEDRWPFSLDYPWHFWIAQNPKQLPGKIIDATSLRSIAERCDIVRSCIEHIKREVKAQPLTVYPIDPEKSSSRTENRVKAATAWLSESGPLGGVGNAQQQFIDKVIEDLLVLGCYSVWYEQNRRGDVISCHAIDVSTIRPVTDGKGWLNTETPYQQYIQGVPIVSFKPGELRYDGLFPKTHTPYYTSPIEWILGPITASMKADDWNRSWLTGSTSHAGDIYTLPDTWTVKQVQEFTAFWDAIMKADSDERRSTKFLPSGSNKLSDFSRHEMDFQEYEMWLLRRICSIFSVQPASIGYAGEQYKVSQDASHEETRRVGLGPIIASLEAFFDDLLFRLGYTDLTCSFKPNDEKVKESTGKRIRDEVGLSFKTINEGRTEAGLDKVEGGDVLMVPAGYTTLGGAQLAGESTAKVMELQVDQQKMTNEQQEAQAQQPTEQEGGAPAEGEQSPEMSVNPDQSEAPDEEELGGDHFDDHWGEDYAS